MSTVDPQCTCGKCGERWTGHPPCPLCGAAESGPAAPLLRRSVREALGDWASSTFGAPRRIEDLVNSVEVSDQVIRRVALEIVRRDLLEQSTPTTRGKGHGAACDAATVDPFEFSAAELRKRTEHVRPCPSCGGEGVSDCDRCDGTGRARCLECDGSGKITRHYTKTSRLINCKECRGRGDTRCDGCVRGRAPCRECSGHGQHEVWLAFKESSRIVVALEPQVTSSSAHPQLTADRFLMSNDLAAFGVARAVIADAPESLSLDDDVIAEGMVKNLELSRERRLERVHRQQYHLLHLVQRDAHYSMCGTTARLRFSGKDLAYQRTLGDTHPIKRRNALWMAGGLLIAPLGMAMFGSLIHRSPYFAAANALQSTLALVGIPAAVLALGALLREAGRGQRLQGLTAVERALGAVAALALCVALVANRLSTPSISDANAALMAGRSVQARVVTGALHEMVGDTPEVRELDERLAIAESRTLALEPQLRILDPLAAGGGPHALEAGTLARSARVAELQQQLAAGAPDETLSLLQRWFGTSWRTDPELAELAAAARDRQHRSCSDAACELLAARAAVDAASTPVRREQLASARSRLLSALGSRLAEHSSTLDQLLQMRQTQTLAEHSVGRFGDAEIDERANEAVAWASTERGRVSLLGAEPEVIAELLGAAVTSDGNIIALRLGGSLVSLALDTRHRCRGLYIVGNSSASRVIGDAQWSAQRLLSQALGGDEALLKAPAGRSVSSWRRNSIPIVARWNHGELWELRIGDATP